MGRRKSREKTQYAGNPDYAWNTNFDNGNQNNNHKDNSARARAVRR